jgi:hypothetical protein
MLLSLAPTDKGLEILFGGVSDGDIASLIGNFFMGRGFVLGSGSPIAGVYETGSAVGRALLGGFVKRQKYSVNIWTDEHGTHARVHSEMSGASGSVVGVVRERRGRDEVKTALQWYLQSTTNRRQWRAHRAQRRPLPFRPPLLSDSWCHDEAKACRAPQHPWAASAWSLRAFLPFIEKVS